MGNVKTFSFGAIISFIVVFAAYPILFKNEFRDISDQMTSYEKESGVNLALSSSKYRKYAGSQPSQLSNFTSVLPTDIRRAMEDRYVLPVVHLGGGPNFQYRQLRIAIQFAVHMNRTIVLPEFTHHRTDYHMGRVSFDETFNASVFSEFMPAISMREVRDKCGSDVSGVWTFFNPSRPASTMTARVYRRYAKWLLEHADIRIPKVNKVLMPYSVDAAWRGIHTTAHLRCVVMLSPISFERAGVSNKDRISQAIDGHLVRTSFLQNCAEDVLPKLCDGKPILGLHWRNKTGEECRMDVEKERTKDAKCDVLLQVQLEIIQNLAIHISSIMKQNNLGCVFIASAPAEPRQNIIKEFYSQGISAILTIDDVLDKHNPDIDSFRHDDYFISLIEQEICARSNTFIGVGKSNWSTFVFRERRAFDRGENYDLIEDFPDIVDVAKDFL